MNSLIDCAASGSVPGGDVADLIARLESAEAGSRELDAAIAKAMGWEVHNARRNGLWVVPFGEYATCDPDKIFQLGEYTTSLDAALALCERVLPGSGDQIVQPVVWAGKGSGFWRVPAAQINFASRDDEAEGGFCIQAGRTVTANAATPALALCAAILKATHHGNEGRQAEVTKHNPKGE